MTGERLRKRLIKLSIYLVFTVLSIRLGILMGDKLASSNARVITRIHPETFKTFLNRSIPLIDMVYNSGRVSSTLGEEIRGAVKYFLGFDLSDPITVLNAQTPSLKSYYLGSYRKIALEKGKSGGSDRREEQGDPGKGEDTAPPDSSGGYKQDASAISWDESDEENRERSEEGVISSGKIQVNNQTKYQISDAFIQELLKEPLSIKIDDRGPQVLIYHTHTSEGYLRKKEDIGKKDVPSRTSDSRYNVVRVGDELAEILRKKYDIEVVHNGTVHDYDHPESYSNALNTVNSVLKGNPSIKVVLDIHRDGLGGGDQKLRVVTDIGGKEAARLMFVVGTDGHGLSHPNWRENLKFAIKLQQKLNEKYPGLMKPIYLSSNRYNQHVRDGALIVEVGGDGNTISEALESVKYLAQAINEVLRNNK